MKILLLTLVLASIPALAQQRVGTPIRNPISAPRESSAPTTKQSPYFSCYAYCLVVTARNRDTLLFEKVLGQGKDAGAALRNLSNLCEAKAKPWAAHSPSSFLASKIAFSGTSVNSIEAPTNENCFSGDRATVVNDDDGPFLP